MIRSRGMRRVLSLALCLWLALGPAAWACTVPVFRYALERWPADPYRVVVFHRGTLSEADQALVDWLKKAGETEYGPPRLLVRTVDLDGEPDKAMQELWTQQQDRTPTLPWTVVLYPFTARIPVPMWSGQLTAQKARRLVDSPLRQQMARRLLDGQTAVWVLLESGDEAKDAAAAKLLQAELKKMEKELRLPPSPYEPMAPQDPAPQGDTPAGDPPPAQPKVAGEAPLPEPAAEEGRVAFSLLRLSRKDPAEALFVQMLLHTEKDLTEFQDPIVFPVFGRGRALFALVGPGIHADNIFESCAFLCGPCACQIKMMAPGTDLLMLTDWDAHLLGETAQEELPPLVGVPDLEAVAAAAKAPQGQETPATSTKGSATPATAEPAPSSQSAQDAAAPPGGGLSPLARNLAIAVAAALAVLGLATAVVVRRSRSPQE